MNNSGFFDLGSKSPITAAVTDTILTLASDAQGVNQPFVAGLEDMGSVTIEAEFDYGFGGTTAIVIIDTSLDQGQNWIEIARFDFATTDRLVAATVSGAAPAGVSTLAALGAEGKRDGYLGDRLRARLTTTGIYSGNTRVMVRAMPRGAGASSNDDVTGALAILATSANQDEQTTLLGSIITALGEILSGPLTVAVHAVTQSGAWVLSAGSAIVGKVGIDQTMPGTTDRVTSGKTTVIDVTLSLDTSAYGAGDVLADTQVVANATRVNDLGGLLATVTLIDKDDQGASLDLWILDANVSMGTENSAPSITDANAVSIIGRIPIGTADYYDLGGCKVAHIKDVALPIRPASGTRDLYMAAVNGSGTPSYTESGLVVRLGMLQD